MPEETPIPSPMQPDETGQIVDTTELPAAPVKNADELRDDKCFPVARAMFALIAANMIPEDASKSVDFNPVVKSLLQLGVDTDLNLTTENPYVYQLMLGQLAGLNVSVQGAVMTPIDDVRYGRIAKQILQFVADANVTLGPVTQDQTVADFAPVMEKINALFAEEKLTMIEVKYIMDNIFDSFSHVQNGYTGIVEASMKQAEEKLWKVTDMSDISLQQVDKVLKDQV